VSDSAPSRWVRAPRIRRLDHRQMEFLLARNTVGRIAFQGPAGIEMQPVHYVYADQAIIGRTSLGSKYRSWMLQQDVVFEIDEAENQFNWRSVIVRGRLSILRPVGTLEAWEAYHRAVAAIRTQVQGAFTERDPTPHREIIFRIGLCEMTGREASRR